MKKVHFNELALKDKALLIREFGCLLQTIEYYDFRIFLYSINHHFVESYYNLGSRQIERIAIANYRDLDKYLSRIIIYDYKNYRSK